MRKVSNQLANAQIEDPNKKKYAIEISDDEDLEDFPLPEAKTNQKMQHKQQRYFNANLAENEYFDGNAAKNLRDKRRKAKERAIGAGDMEIVDPRALDYSVDQDRENED